MSTPIPVLRAPVPGQRNGNNQQQARAPRLGLAIPNSPNVKPVNPNPPPLEINPMLAPSAPMPLAPLSMGGGLGASSSRPAPPTLRLPSLGGLNTQLGPSPGMRPARPQISLQPLAVAGGGGGNMGGGENVFDHPYMDPHSSASSSVSQLQDSALTGSTTGSPRPKDGDSGQEIKELQEHLAKLTVSLNGQEPDAGDLDNEGWRAVSELGKLETLSELGEGAGGAVTRCRIKGGKTVFALKVITTNTDPDVKRQIVRELSFNSSCRSDYICRYFGAFADATGTVSIAMEFCEGGSLDAIYKEVQRLGGRTGEKVLAKVAHGVLNGLQYLSSLNIMHRDIKPSNILLCRNGQVKLCDFGVSGEFGTKGDASTFIGTSYYMAPERIQGQSYTINSDVWSLGVTLMEVAQHRFPFPADGTAMQPRAALFDLLTYIVRLPTPELKDDPPIFWSQSMKDFIKACFIKDPKLRKYPEQMLQEQWMVESRSKRVNMEKFLRDVWDWQD